ncbi:MAG TPA: radical SAM family heme chaperone HemW [Amaricoccus sp.]|uniref:radical SAM family heme chaperone HemW n=1 Tax=Amaricoccus sp. TaxID=1872485 RepID=UPI002B7DA495|nr:radical SAM family heme chaperone HemW [Amaricoccus sp.]HMQ94561.1 radical SAM family heme chaperone HemW [Amaricoccus sp.]HMR50989.1 radical SAM family heme chaperone HemW [Amaricoccus sp.]HMT97832.1 radical SAM family heme chaperone HemW [Amaricoccus sp.]
MTEDWRSGGFGIYVHWPFCLAKCPYCDFNSHVRTGIDEARWRRALVGQVAAVARQVPGRVVDTIFFGGGTPSLMPPDTLAAVIAAVRDAWPLAGDAEITLEANPTSVEAGRFRGFRDAGVNRVSMGIQALDDGDLRRLGRMHNVAEAIRAYEIARGTFARVSFDLIYARQGQTLEQWRTELGRALALALDHLSLYQLTIEDGTRFGDMQARGRLRGLPDADLAADMYAVTQETCDAAGMGGYEISNHARPGAESRHNLIYWRYGDYAGIGPGAHGRLTLRGRRWAIESPRSPDAWLSAAEGGTAEIAIRSEVETHDQGAEMLMMGLRLREGVDLGRYARLTGRALPAVRIAELSDLGLLECDGSRISATDSGRIVLNTVIKQLLDQ